MISPEQKIVSNDGLFSWMQVECLGAWGNNFDGSMGINIGGPSGRRSSPVQIPGMWKQMSSGNAGGVMATRYNGSLWTWR